MSGLFTVFWFCYLSLHQLWPFRPRKIGSTFKMNIWITTHTHKKKKHTDAPSHMHRLGLWHLFEQWFYEWITLFLRRLSKFLPAQKPLSLTWRSKNHTSCPSCGFSLLRMKRPIIRQKANCVADTMVSLLGAFYAIIFCSFLLLY